MGKGAKGGSGRDGRLASALRDNLRRRKAASRPDDGPSAQPSADSCADAAPPAKTADNARET